MGRLAGEGVRVEVVVVVLVGEIMVLDVVGVMRTAVLDGEVELLGVDELVAEDDVGGVSEFEKKLVMLSGPAVGYEVIMITVEGVAFEVKIEVVMSERNVVEPGGAAALFKGASAELKVELAKSGRTVPFSTVVKSERVLGTSDVCCENVDAEIVVVIAADRDPVMLLLEVKPGVLDVLLVPRVCEIMVVDVVEYVAMVVLLVNGPAAKPFAVEPIRTITKLIMVTTV